MRKLLGRNAIGTLASSLETLLLLLGSAAQSLSGPSAQSKVVGAGMSSRVHGLTTRNYIVWKQGFPRCRDGPSFRLTHPTPCPCRCAP